MRTVEIDLASRRFDDVFKWYCALAIVAGVEGRWLLAEVRAAVARRAVGVDGCGAGAVEEEEAHGGEAGCYYCCRRKG